MDEFNSNITAKITVTHETIVLQRVYNLIFKELHSYLCISCSHIVKQFMPVSCIIADHNCVDILFLHNLTH